MKKNVAIVGAQWGDEGKGKIVDILSEDFDCVARYQGGHNAGHTVSVGDRRHVLHLIPSGIFHPGVRCVIGAGVVLDPLALIEEQEGLEALGVAMEGRLFISNRCHLILPYHRSEEAAIESQLGEYKIGTTLRGIGPAYEDKAGRRGLSMCDLLDSDNLAARIQRQVEQKNRILQAVYHEPAIDAEPICKAYAEYGQRLRPYVIDCSAFLNGLIREGKSIDARHVIIGHQNSGAVELSQRGYIFRSGIFTHLVAVQSQDCRQGAAQCAVIVDQDDWKQAARLCIQIDFRVFSFRHFRSHWLPAVFL